MNDFNIEAQRFEDYKIKELGETLARLQRKLIDAQMPVVLIVEGWESSGHHEVIREFVRELNPRNYRVTEFDYYETVDENRPIMTKYWGLLPVRGDMTIFDRSYYFRHVNYSRFKSNKAYPLIEEFEKLLHDDGYLVLKFFLHVDKDTHKKRLKELEEDPLRSFFVDEVDLRQFKKYKKFKKRYLRMAQQSHFEFAPWHVIDATDIKDAAREVLGITIERIESALKSHAPTKNGYQSFHGPYPLNNLDLSKAIDEDVYDQQLDDLQDEIEKMTYRFYQAKVPVVLVFEGMDAAGKGGAIERLTKKVDPRFYDVVTISAPTKLELSHHYLWRFYREFPTRGKMRIFDRSWYGRVMVERIEGFATDDQWKRAYDEINIMEKQLMDEGMFMMKFFITISKDEQLSRFEDRQNDVDKVYKLTDEDWRNRDKWDDYVESMNEMLVKTSTEHAPWIVVEGNDKKFARIKVLSEFVQRAKAFLDSLE